MTEQEQRFLVVEEAKTWLNTPYHANAKIKGAGVDCGMLLLGVFENAGLIPATDIGYYSPDFYLHRSEPLYLQWIEKYCKKVKRDPFPGDIVLYNFGRTPAHGAIVIDWPIIIHAYRPFMFVALDDAINNEELSKRFFGTYSFWG